MNTPESESTRSRMRRAVLRLSVAVSLAIGVVLAPLAATSASATNTNTPYQTPGSYAWAPYAAGNSMSVTMTVTRNPGHEAAVFWSNQFGFTNPAAGQSGYMGLQTSPTGGSFRASIWGGDNSTCPTTAGASCGFSVEGSQFAFLRLDQTFSPNIPYTFTMTKAAGDWWVFTVVVNHGASPTIQLGSMHVPSNGQVNQLTNDGGQFTEYFQPGDNKTLEGDATDEATVGAPVIDGVQTLITSTQPDPLNETSIIDGGAALYTNFLPNNSARDPITLAGSPSRGLLGGSSLSLGPINLATGSGVQSWVFGFDGTVRGTDFLCLTAGAGNTVTTSACPNVNVPTQTWHYLNDGEIINPATGLCLMAPAAATSTGPLQLAVCKAVANERFTAPAYTKVYPISGEKLATESITGNAPDTRTGANFMYRYLSNSVDGCAPNAVTGAFPVRAEVRCRDLHAVGNADDGRRVQLLGLDQGRPVQGERHSRGRRGIVQWQRAEWDGGDELLLQIHLGDRVQCDGHRNVATRVDVHCRNLHPGRHRRRCRAHSRSASTRLTSRNTSMTRLSSRTNGSPGTRRIPLSGRTIPTPIRRTRRPAAIRGWRTDRSRRGCR